MTIATRAVGVDELRLERVTGIEPALSAWEADDGGFAARP